MKKSFDYHTVVIGAGRVGSHFAKNLARFGAKVLIIDKNEIFGGKQFNRDVPIQILQNTLDKIEKKMSLDEKFKFFRSELNLKLHNLIEKTGQNSFTKLGIDSLIGTVHIVDKNNLIINEKKISFKYCVFAVGSRFLKPLIKGLDYSKYETIENWYNFDKNFNSVTIIGNDKNSLELAITFAESGSIVYLLNKNDNFINLLKDDMLLKFQNYARKNNFYIINNASIKNINKTETDQFQIEYSIGTYSLFLISDRLILGGTKKGNLDKVSKDIIFETNLRNFPISDRQLRLRNNKNFFAIGSCFGPYIDSNQGFYQANLIINNLIENDERNVFDFENFSSNINAKIGFSFIGMHEDEIKSQKIFYNKFEYDFKESNLSIVNDKDKGFIRAYFDKKHRLLNASIVGENITEISSVFLWMYNSQIKINSLNSFQTLPFTNLEILKEILTKYIFEYVFNEKKLAFIHKYYLKTDKNRG